MPIKRMIPNQGDHAQIHAAASSARRRPHPRRGQRGQDRDRVDVALVEHPQHRCRRHPAPPRSAARSLASEALKACAVPGSSPGFPGQPELPRRRLDRRHRSPSATPGQVERERHPGNCPWWFTGARSPRLEAREGAQRHLRAGGRPHVDVPQGVGALHNRGSTSITTCTGSAACR